MQLKKKGIYFILLLGCAQIIEHLHALEPHIQSSEFVSLVDQAIEQQAIEQNLVDDTYILDEPVTLDDNKQQPPIDNENNHQEDDVEQDDAGNDSPEDLVDDSEPTTRIINNIFIEGNQQVPIEAILDRLPFQPGEPFQPHKTRLLIRNLYFELKRFKNIIVEAEDIDDDKIDLYIVVQEKIPLLSVAFKGNSQVTEKEILEKINFNEIPSIDVHELENYKKMIAHMYKDKGYLLTEISYDLVEVDGKAHVTFTFVEHKKSIVKQIEFFGNNNISGKILRANMFTREDWVLSFMDKSGTYNAEWLERDKHIIEQYYQNNGFINAKVYKTDVDMDPHNKQIKINIFVDEGDMYHFGNIEVSGADMISQDFLLANMPVKSGEIYSREAIVDAIKFLEYIFSDFGFLYTQIEPSIQPNDVTKVVDIHFKADPGRRVFLNKLTIRGNQKTRDKIIRRNIPMEEGNIVTTKLMEISKNKVESLGYFDTRDGVNWKTTRISDDQADLDLVVKEVKTGNMHMKIGFGGPEMLRDDKSRNWVNQIMTGVSFEGSISDTNIAGTGIRFNLTGKLSTQEQDLLINLTQPWLFDKPIYGSIDGLHRRASYDQLSYAFAMNEQRTSISGTLGVVTGWRKLPLFNDTYIRYNLGVDRLSYDKNPQAIPPNVREPERSIAQAEYQGVLDKLFYPGACAVHYGWMNLQMGQDKKNHPMHPSRGHTWMMRGIFAFPSFDSNIGYAKWDLDANWFTPLIGEYDLVFRLHGYAGFIKPFHHRIIPYRELFHIGGPASIRGFLFGQIGPQFTVPSANPNRNSDSIGAEKTVFFNAELIFPVMPDMSFKALVFYDGGAAWDNPYAHCLSPEFLRNNRFEYRHAVGIGLRLLNPMPMKIDWGFKLDPKKGESGFEVHFAMGYDWQ